MNGVVCEIERGKVIVNGTLVDWERFLDDQFCGDKSRAIGFLADHLGISQREVRQQLLPQEGENPHLWKRPAN